MTALLEIAKLNVEFSRRQRLGKRAVAFRAVDDVSLIVNAGETVGLVGESGSGKTTVGRAILGLVRPVSGEIRFEGTDIAHLPAGQRRALASEIQVVFQDPYSSLNPSLTVGESLAEPLRVVRGASKADAINLVGDALKSVGLPSDASRRYPNEFSGGQRQRVAIARALVVHPKLIVCDEAVSALDRSTQAQVANLLGELQAKTGVAYLFISHDLAVVRHLSQRVVVLYRGQVVETGPAVDVCDHPKHPYTQALLAAAPVSDPRLQRERRRQRSQLAAPTTAQDDRAAACPFAPRCPHAEEVCWEQRPTRSIIGTTLVACHLYDDDSGHTLAGTHRHVPQNGKVDPVALSSALVKSKAVQGDDDERVA